MSDCGIFQSSQRNAPGLALKRLIHVLSGISRIPSNPLDAHVAGQSDDARSVKFAGRPAPDAPCISRQPSPLAEVTPAKYFPNCPSAGPIRVTIGETDVSRNGVE